MFYFCIWSNASKSLLLYVDYLVEYVCVCNIAPWMYRPFNPKADRSMILGQFFCFVFFLPWERDQGWACWLFKDYSKLLFLLIKKKTNKNEKKDKTKQLNIDHTSHFRDTVFNSYDLFPCKTFFWLYLVFVCTFQKCSGQRFCTIFSYEFGFKCELSKDFFCCLLVCLCWRFCAEDHTHSLILTLVAVFKKITWIVSFSMYLICAGGSGFVGLKSIQQFNLLWLPLSDHARLVCRNVSSSSSHKNQRTL